MKYNMHPAMRRHFAVLHSGVAIAALAMAAPGYSQTADAQTGPKLYDDAGDIVVTARQRSETLLETPVAVNAVSGATLSRLALTDTRSLAKLAPSLSIEQSSSGAGGSISLRGIGTSPSNAGFDQAVSVNVDGVQTGRARIIMLGMLDIAQVEVMKGPQALFFGKNSPAGVISMSSADPTDELEIRASGGYEFVADEVILEGSVSGPLTDSLGARLAVRYRKMEGWLRNTAGQLTSSPFAGPNNLPQAPATDRPGEDEVMGRLTLAFQPEGSPISANFKLAGMRYTNDGPSAGQQLYNCGAFKTPVVVYAGIPAIAVDPFGDCKLNDKYSNGALPVGYSNNWPVAEQNPYSKINMVLGRLQLVYDADKFSVTSVTGFFQSKTQYFDNYDATVYMAYDAAEREDYTSLSQEVRVHTKLDSPVNLMIGGFYQGTNLDFFNASLIAPLPVDPLTGKYHTWEKPGQTDGTTLSVFGQAMWDITPEIELSGGVRYTYEVKDSMMVNTYVHPPLSGTVLAPQGKIFSDHFTDNNLSPEVTLTWRPTADFTTYAAYKTGYKSGGFGISTNLIPANITAASIRFESEKIKGFEGGVKARILDRRVTLTGSIYSYKYTNLQVNSFDAATTSFRITNAASARVKGAELDVYARPTDWLTLNGGIAYNNARYLDYLAGCWGGQTAAMGCNVTNANGSKSQDMSGRPLTRAPDWTANAGFDVDLPAGAFRVGFTGNTRFSDDYIAIDNGNPFGTQQSFWLFDASARIGAEEGLWELALIGRNLSNKFVTGYIAEKPGSPSTPGTTSQLMGLPNRGRQVMLQAKFSF